MCIRDRDKGRKKGRLSSGELMEALEEIDLESEQMDKMCIRDRSLTTSFPPPSSGSSPKGWGPRSSTGRG